MTPSARPTNPLHGTNAVTDGKLKGSTDTDYFYFFCPACEGQEILRIVHYRVNSDEAPTYAPNLHPKATRDFVIAFELHCEKCGLHDTVKISNTGWQGGQLHSE